MLLSTIVVFVTDISGIADTLKEALGRWLNVKIERLKPFDCSLCMVWWCGLAYLFAVGRFALGPVAFVALLAAGSAQTGASLRLICRLLQRAIDLIFDVIEK